MKNKSLSDHIEVPSGSSLKIEDYCNFIEKSVDLFKQHPQYMCESEGLDSIELAHLILQVPETVLAIYIGINDAVCNKGLLTPFLPRHSHNNVFVFDPQVWPGKDQIPSGTIDAKSIVNGFTPPNRSWSENWTYIMIADSECNHERLWAESGYIDMIPAKFEDFTMLSDHKTSRLCIFIDPVAFTHPVNEGRDYLKAARKRGDSMASDFIIPEALSGETEGLVPVILHKGEKLYVARPDFKPCDHCWCNIHEENEELAVVNENSAVPLNLVINKPRVSEKYRSLLIPPAGSADSTTDWFFRGNNLFRKPIKPGHISG